MGRVLGQGGFGITYVAWDQKLSARVAVKEYMPGEMAARLEGTTVYVMAAERTEDFAYGEERFKEEARTLAKFMGQPNIAGVTDYFDENQTSYFVMDYIEGISFKTYIANAGGRVSPKEALNVMIPVLRALTAVHGEGFIHRDVTPDNIYITKDGNVKLLDFGSARYSLGDKSKSLDVILKVGYAPKEQYIRRGRQGPYTDVYSCAACLYAAITGYLPPEALERLDHDELVPPSQAGVELPLYLERAILKGLAVQPEDRFQTAAQFLETLESQTVAELPEACGAGLSGSQAAAGLPGGQAAADFAGKAGASASEDALSPGQKAGKTRKSRRPLPLILGGAPQSSCSLPQAACSAERPDCRAAGRPTWPGRRAVRQRTEALAAARWEMAELRTARRSRRRGPDGGHSPQGHHRRGGVQHSPFGAGPHGEKSDGRGSHQSFPDERPHGPAAGGESRDFGPHAPGGPHRPFGALSALALGHYGFIASGGAYRSHPPDL